MEQIRYACEASGIGRFVIALLRDIDHGAAGAVQKHEVILARSWASCRSQGARAKLNLSWRALVLLFARGPPGPRHGISEELQAKHMVGCSVLGHACTQPHHMQKIGYVWHAGTGSPVCHAQKASAMIVFQHCSNVIISHNLWHNCCGIWAVTEHRPHETADLIDHGL